ncbi:MAG: hypothetical protein O2967_00675 [Proteobacteria bacterium]|nr:hypothetical protein [Pseudomonadota bacterium]
MNEKSTIYLTETTRGTFLAATNTSPYFCLEAETEAALKEKVRALILFYDASRTARFVSPSFQINATQFIPTGTIEREELLAVG